MFEGMNLPKTILEPEMNTEDAAEIKRIRHRSFVKKIPLDKELTEIVSGYESHSFLKNPAGQNVYLYLCDYVKILSEYWFKKGFQELKILDWGCGKGQVTFLLGGGSANVVSCDVKEDTIDSSYGQETPIIDNAKIKVIQLEHEYLLPFNDEEFDVILSFGVLEHVANDSASIKELSRVLKPTGLFFCFNLPYFLSWTQKISYLFGNKYHDRVYRHKGICSLLREGGFHALDLWHRQLFPKNEISYPGYRLFERLDLFLVRHTFLRFFSTSIEFVASKK